MPRPHGPKRCLCVANHTPEPRELHRHHIHPLFLGGPDVAENLVWLCPSSHSNVHMLLRRWLSNDGSPKWWTRRLFHPYIRRMAERGFYAWDTAGRP